MDCIGTEILFLKIKVLTIIKWKVADSQGIKLVQIYEDEWRDKKEIIKSRLKNLMNFSDYKIYARECEIKSVSF